MQSLKQNNILSKACHIFAITETLLKDNEKINIQHFKWIGLSRKNKDGGGIVFLINKSIIKTCTIEPSLNKTIEFMSIKLNLTNNESMMACLYYGKQESRSTKKESENEFNQISTYTKNGVDNSSYVLILGDFNAKIGNDKAGIKNGDRIISRNGFLLMNMITMQHLQLINSVPCCMGKWTSVNTCNNNEKSIIDYGLCNSKLTSMISKVIIDEPQEYKLKGRKHSDHNTSIIDINTKTKHLEMVGKSAWKINEKTDWKKCKELMQNKIQNYNWNTKNSTEYTEKIYTVLH